MNNLTQPTTPVASTRPLSKWFDPHPSLGISLIDHLFNRLDGAYPNKWRSNFANQQAIDNWAESWVEAFEDEGITPADVQAGLKVIRKRCEWPPSCAEFIKACKPGLDPLVAYYEAVAGVQARANGEMGVWSHPAIYHAAMPLSFDLSNQTYSQIKARWERALEAQFALSEWPEIPQPMLQLAAPGKSATSKEAATAMLKGLDAAGVSKSAGDRVDHKAWARRIKEREARGDKTLTAYQVREANIALQQEAPSHDRRSGDKQ